MAFFRLFFFLLNFISQITEKKTNISHVIQLLSPKLLDHWLHDLMKKHKLRQRRKFATKKTEFVNLNIGVTKKIEFLFVDGNTELAQLQIVLKTT